MEKQEKDRLIRELFAKGIKFNEIVDYALENRHTCSGEILDIASDYMNPNNDKYDFVETMKAELEMLRNCGHSLPSTYELREIFEDYYDESDLSDEFGKDLDNDEMLEMLEGTDELEDYVDEKIQDHDNENEESLERAWDMVHEYRTKYPLIIANEHPDKLYEFFCNMFGIGYYDFKAFKKKLVEALNEMLAKNNYMRPSDKDFLSFVIAKQEASKPLITLND